MSNTAIADAAVAAIGGTVATDIASIELAFTTMSADTTSQDREFIPTTELFAIILDNVTEWEALSANDQQVVRDVLVVHAVTGIPTTAGEAARTVLVDKLGTATKAAVAAAIPETVPVWPGLTIGNVSDALFARERGDY